MSKRRARWSGRLRKRSRSDARLARFEQLEPRMLLTGLPYGAVARDTGEYLLGNVVATVVFFESDGSIDPNLENWNPLVRNPQGDVVLDGEGHTTSASGPNLIEETKGRVVDGLEWWEDTLTNFYELNYDDVDQIHSLNFIYDFEYAHNPIATGYEPIYRTSNDYSLWVSDFLREVGYLETGFMDYDIRAFNNAQRLKYDADWAYTIFVANDYEDADGRFAFGGRFQQAFAFSGGRFLVSPAQRPASTFAHESGHIFYARDEYDGSGAHYTDQRGYYNSQNWNAYDNPTEGFVQQPSIMDTDADLLNAWNTHTSAASSLAMLGWQDSDGDGVFDVLDVPLTLSGTGYYDSTLGRFHFLGSSKVQTLVNVNSSGLTNDISINEVSRLVYSLDDGLTWQLARNYDAPEVEIDFTRVLQPGQEILLRTEAVDPITGQIVATSSEVFRGSSALPTTVLQSGIDGFVWDDRNTDGAWDLNERGVSGWTLQLVDDQGTPIETAQYLDPDAFANQSLLNTVLAGVTLSAIGWDTKDTRVGAIDTTGEAGGDRVFGMLRSAISDQWLTEWTADSRVLRIDFDTPTTFVSIDAIAPNSGAYGRLEIYDSAGNMLGRTTTGALEENEVASLAIGVATPEIAYALVRSTVESTILLDNLQAGPSAAASSGYFGAYALPYLPPGDYHVMAVPDGDWTVAASGIVDVSVTADGSMLWPTESDRPSDFAALLGPAASLWKNHAFAVDVNDDWIVSPIDALLVIYDLNENGNRVLSAATDPVGKPFVDVTGDGIASPRDALYVIAALNAGSQSQGDEQSDAASVVGWSAGVMAAGSSEGEAVNQEGEGFETPLGNAPLRAGAGDVAPAVGVVMQQGISWAPLPGSTAAHRSLRRATSGGVSPVAWSSLFEALGDDDRLLASELLSTVPRRSLEVSRDRRNERDAGGVHDCVQLSKREVVTAVADSWQAPNASSDPLDELLTLLAADALKQPLPALFPGENLAEEAQAETPAS